MDKYSKALPWGLLAIICISLLLWHGVQTWRIEIGTREEKIEYNP